MWSIRETMGIQCNIMWSMLNQCMMITISAADYLQSLTWSTLCMFSAKINLSSPSNVWLACHLMFAMFTNCTWLMQAVIYGKLFGTLLWNNLITWDLTCINRNAHLVIWIQNPWTPPYTALILIDHVPECQNSFTWVTAFHDHLYWFPHILFFQ